MIGHGAKPSLGNKANKKNKTKRFYERYLSASPRLYFSISF